MISFGKSSGDVSMNNYALSNNRYRRETGLRNRVISDRNGASQVCCRANYISK